PDALIADVHRWAGDQLLHFLLVLAAEGARQIAVVIVPSFVHFLFVRRFRRATYFFSSFFLTRISSTTPYSLASAADMKKSRSVSCLILSIGCPLCLASSSFILSRVLRISFAWMSMSVAWPWKPPSGWCSMM